MFITKARRTTKITKNCFVQEHFVFFVALRVFVKNVMA